MKVYVAGRTQTQSKKFYCKEMQYVEQSYGNCSSSYISADQQFVLGQKQIQQEELNQFCSLNFLIYLFCILFCGHVNAKQSAVQDCQSYLYCAIYMSVLDKYVLFMWYYNQLFRPTVGTGIVFVQIVIVFIIIILCFSP